MFDKLIESEPEGADFKNRRRYFMVSSVVVGILFATAVVVSIFAADYGLGTGSFELAEILTPVEMAAPEPEPPRPQQPASTSRNVSDVPTRQIAMSRIDEPTIAPTTISTSRNTAMSRPPGDYDISKFDTNPGVPGGSSRDTSGSGNDPAGKSGLAQDKNPIEDTDNSLPPPILKKREEPRRMSVSKGVLNGEAKSLPKPSYSAAAKAIRAQGKVTVQVTVDESGTVISARAIDGNPILRADAEKAARSARFSPTLLSDMPVKVTGIITYNFIL